MTEGYEGAVNGWISGIPLIDDKWHVDGCVTRYEDDMWMDVTEGYEGDTWMDICYFINR